MLLDEYVQAAFVAILRDDATLRAIVDKNGVPVVIADWADETKVRGQIGVSVKADTPKVWKTNGQGVAVSWSIKVECDPFSYVADDKNLELMKPLYDAVYKCVNGITVEMLQARLEGQTVYCAIMDDASKALNQNISQFTVSKIIYLA